MLSISVIKNIEVYFIFLKCVKKDQIYLLTAFFCGFSLLQRTPGNKDEILNHFRDDMPHIM